METKTSLVEQLENLLEENKTKVKDKKSSLTVLLRKISKRGLLEKSEYSLPLKDTLGKTLHSHFNSFS